MTKVMISCGEPSGDLYAGALVTEIRRLQPDTRVFGLGGDHLHAAIDDAVRVGNHGKTSIDHPSPIDADIAVVVRVPQARGFQPCNRISYHPHRRIQHVLAVL